VPAVLDLFAPVRQRILDLGMDDAEIDEMIDQAVEEVRARRSATAVAEAKGDYRLAHSGSAPSKTGAPLDSGGSVSPVHRHLPTNTPDYSRS